MEKEKMNFDISVMLKCVSEAKKSKGFTKTNPLVGAAVVKDGRIISIGSHLKFGEAHAEVNAINKAGEYVKGADLYVTLEPCSTFGKTPPCADKIISSGIKRVFVGCVDINPKHAGAGIDKLRNSGIETFVGVGLKECSLLIEDFIKGQIEKMPYVTLKTAVSVDGKIAASSGDSKWITGVKARKLVHKMRSEADGILTGIGTVSADDPTLNNRNKQAKRQPSRIVLDSFCGMRSDCNLVKTAKDIPLMVFVSQRADKAVCRRLSDMGVIIEEIGETKQGILDLKSVLKCLYDRSMGNIMVEAGSNLSGSFNDENLIDKLEEFIAPKIIGGVSSYVPFGGKGSKSMNEVSNFCSSSIKKIGDDFLLSARLKDYAKIAIDATLSFMEGF